MSAREVAVPNSDALNRLATTLERTNELLANSERDGLLRNLNSSRWKSEGYLSMDALTEMMERERAAGDGWPQKTQDELRQRHAGWTREDLFGRYGAPTSVEAGERGLTVLYGSTSFFIAEGLVISGRYK